MLDASRTRASLIAFGFWKQFGLCRGNWKHTIIMQHLGKFKEKPWYTFQPLVALQINSETTRYRATWNRNWSRGFQAPVLPMLPFRLYVAYQMTWDSAQNILSRQKYLGMCQCSCCSALSLTAWRSKIFQEARSAERGLCLVCTLLL